MNDFDKEYEGILKLLEDEPACPDTSAQREKQDSQKRPAPQRSPKKSGRSAKCPPAGKYKQQRWKIVSACVLALVLLAAAVVMVCKSRFGSEGDLTALKGVWRYDPYTEYTFDGKGGGYMCIGEPNHYAFTYTADGDTLKIDFAFDYVTDCEYNFELENDQLTLIGGKGTANPGQKYTLERMQ